MKRPAPLVWLVGHQRREIMRLHAERRRDRRLIADLRKSALSAAAALGASDGSLYLAHERIEWLQGQIENQDDLRVLHGWLSEEETG